MIKKKRITRLGVKLLGAVVASGILSYALFQLFFSFRMEILQFIVSEDTLKKNSNIAYEQIQEEIEERQILRSDERRLRREIRKFPTMSIQLYDEEGNYYLDYISPRENQTFIETTSVLLKLYTPKPYSYELNFSDGKLTMTILSFSEVTLMIFYLLAVLVASAVMFISLILLFVHHKMRYVLQIEQEMSLIESGDYTHDIQYKGKDEITSLAMQLDSLRSTLQEKVAKEEEARKANQELVTAMSHDLRTPLTSLLGYLDILQMKIYRDEAQREEYVRKSKGKAEQIKELSDRLFNHFLLYAQDEEYALVPISSDMLNAMLEAQCEDLLDKEFILHLEIDEKPYVMQGDRGLLKRILDNLFANIRKYAAGTNVQVCLKAEEGSLCLTLENRKKKDLSREESSGIGLKSVEKMTRYMKGTLLYEDRGETFYVRLSFPCTLKKEEAFV